MSLPADPARRFGGVARVYGDAGLARLAQAHVVVIGVGGVGSWSAEALARSGVGRITLVDLDHVAESNINRQVLALGSTLGASKVEVMAARIADIAPGCVVGTVDDFVTPDNLDALLPAADVIIDAIDQPRAKAALIAWCRRRRRALVVCGAAGGRTDPLRLRREDLALTRGDALLSGVRARLRREHGFTREAGRRFGVVAVFSDETAPRVEICDVMPAPAGEASEPAAAAGLATRVTDANAAGTAQAGQGGAPLGCAGYGSLVSVTATMGLAAAQWAIDRIVRAARSPVADEKLSKMIA